MLALRPKPTLENEVDPDIAEIAKKMEPEPSYHNPMLEEFAAIVSLILDKKSALSQKSS